MVVTTISLFFQTYSGIYKAKSHHLHLSPANDSQRKNQMGVVCSVSQSNFLSYSFVNLISVMFSWHDSNTSSCISTSAILICNKKYCFLTFRLKYTCHSWLKYTCYQSPPSLLVHRESRSDIMVVSKNSYFNTITNFRKKPLKKQHKKITITKTYTYGHFFKLT